MVVSYKSQRGSGVSLPGTQKAQGPQGMLILNYQQPNQEDLKQTSLGFSSGLSYPKQTDGKNTIDKNSKYNFVVQSNLVIFLVYSAFPLPTFFLFVLRKEKKACTNYLIIE